jgi:hypothetical protein
MYGKKNIIQHLHLYELWQKMNQQNIYVKIVVRECMGKEKTKVKWFIKCLENKIK